jgi:hypothetical protein
MNILIIFYIVCIVLVFTYFIYSIRFGTSFLKNIKDLEKAKAELKELENRQTYSPKSVLKTGISSDYKDTEEMPKQIVKTFKEIDEELPENDNLKLFKENYIKENQRIEFLKNEIELLKAKKFDKKNRKELSAFLINTSKIAKLEKELNDLTKPSIKFYTPEERKIIDEINIEKEKTKNKEIVPKQDKGKLTVKNEDLIISTNKTENTNNVSELIKAFDPGFDQQQGFSIQIKSTKSEEEQSTIKFIGFQPVNVFEQSVPYKYPIVIMPKPKSVIKFPRKGKSRKKGYKEADFLVYVQKYFRTFFQIFDDRIVQVKNNNNPFEPDITLIDESKGINIFVDIEIDEPYEGSNDILNRKPTHYQGTDINRNNSFKNRGWIVIRFAEIQVHKEPISCCRFIADVILSINSKFLMPNALMSVPIVQQVEQWTKEQALIWSREKYRENYLGIINFGIVIDINTDTNIEETEIGKKIEEIVKDDPFVDEGKETEAVLPFNSLKTTIASVISNSEFLKFNYITPQIVKPINIQNEKLIAFCYIENNLVKFDLNKISNYEVKQSPFTQEIEASTYIIDQIRNIIKTAIVNGKYLRLAYQKPYSDQEPDIRTISNVQLSINVLSGEHISYYGLNQDYITAYCHLRKEERTFKIQRILTLQILDL